MKGKIFLFLFALPFFGVGVFMLYLVSSNLVDVWQMQDWQATPATLSNAGYSSHTGDDSTTYEAYATYTYVFGGISYSGSRVGLSSGADNIGNYQTQMGHRLERAWRNGEAITVYVDPANATESIIDRDVRWGLVGFKSIFALVFGGVGLGLIIYVFRSRPAKDPADPAYKDAPWFANDDWQSATIRSGSKTAMYVSWGFAAFWNLISAPLPFVVYGEVVDKQNYVALVGLLFPLIGAGLIVWAVRRQREWTRFGPTPVTLDPFPGSIGGNVGGTIDIRLPYASANAFKMTLTAVESYVSGSGKNRSRREKARWQDTVIAHTEPSAEGTRVLFRFDVPGGLSGSDAVQDNDRYHIWRLNLTSELPGADLDRDFEIPVYPTGELSESLPEQVLDRARDAQESIDDRSIRERLNITQSMSGKTVLYPAGRNLASSIGGVLVGAIFTGAGWFLVTSEGERVFGSIFGGVGALIAVGSLYMVLNSLQVTLQGMTITTVRRVLGLPVRRQTVRSDAVTRFSKDSRTQTQSGNTHVMHYSIFLHDNAGQKICVGEGFKGENEASAAIRLLKREFGIRSQNRVDDDRASGSIDALAADN